MSTEDPHTEAPPQPEAVAPPAPPVAEAPPSAPPTSGPSTNTLLLIGAVVVLLGLGGYFLAQNRSLFSGGGQSTAANYSVQAFTPTTELITGSDRVTAYAYPDTASAPVVVFGQGVTLNVTGRVSRGLGNDWYAITWNNQQAFVRVGDAATGTGAPPTPAEHQIQPPREVKPDEDEDTTDTSIFSDDDQAPPQSNSFGMELRNYDWVRAPSASDFARYYPDRALDRGRSGRVVLNCTADGSGRLSCAVAEESPDGFGFGRAALSIASQLRIQPTLPDGRSVEGGHLRLPLNFRAD